MVLWEIAVGTAYFLGLKRTYKLALKIQRTLISPKHPKIREFAQRRTRAAFDMALTVHRKIQERDIEVGRNLGNWILRWLDRMKPTAQIRVKHLSDGNVKANMNMKRPLSNSSHHPNNQGGFPKSSSRNQDWDSSRRLFTAARNMWPKPFPTIALMTHRTRPVGSNIQYRQFGNGSAEAFTVDFGNFGFGLFRNDVKQWILQN